jgi:hypothetical protein
MARTYLVFGDIEGKLDVLRVECTKCDRRGCYHVHKLIANRVSCSDLAHDHRQTGSDGVTCVCWRCKLSAFRL